ncbi:PGAP1-like protein, partial [Rozella allomycis CSF55]
MSFMRPTYIKVEITSAYALKYSLYMYKEQTDSYHLGIPILFIPGNAGSYKQMRSLASEAFYQDSTFDFYGVDTNEELSAFHGRSLIDQADYLNDVIKNLEEFYSEKFIIIGHSMGGVVARMLFSLPSYKPGSVGLVLTLSTPHTHPRAPLEYESYLIYNIINGRKYHINDAAVISVANGMRDTMIDSESSIIGSEFGNTYFLSEIPFVWTSCGHQEIV